MSSENIMISGWKSIGAHFGRDRTTAIRWAKTRALPVRRLPGAAASSVFAYTAELDAWVRGSSGIGETATENSIVSQAQLPNDPTIAERFIEARGHWAQRDSESLLLAIEAFRSVIFADPSFALAHAALADCYILIGDYGAYTYASSYPLARIAAEKALAIDPLLASAHRGLGSYHYFWSRNTQAAGEAFRRAVELKPDDLLTRIWFGNALIDNCEFEAASQHHNRARLLDSGPLPLAVNRAWAQYLEGNAGEGITRLRQLSRQFPTNALVLDYLYLALLGEGDVEGSLECLSLNEQAKAMDVSQSRAACLVKAWRCGGAVAFADEAIKMTEADERMRPAPDSAMAALFASAAGQRDRFYAILKAADTRSETWAAGWIAHVLLRRWRDDPDVCALLAARYALRMDPRA